MNVFQVNQGDSSTIRQISVDGVADLSIDNWTANAVLVENYGQETPLLTQSCSLDATNAYFEAYWTPTQTNGLETGTYYWIITLECTDLDPDFKREVRAKLIVRPQGA